jgi:hypothetical protein
MIKGVYVLLLQFVTGAYGSLLFVFQWFYQCSIYMIRRVHNWFLQLLLEEVANHKH